MSDIILHHYWESPYAEKVRRILGFKRLAWRSVIIPMIMPKPDLTALTGGYRKTPVLQLGADIYCDTDLIARTIDRLHPEPSLFPDAGAPLSYMLGAWQGELFWLAVRTVGASAPVFPPGFVEDRATMIEGGLSIERAIRDAPAQREQLRAKLDLLDTHLRERQFVLGARPSLADFSLFHPVWPIKMVPQTTAMLEPFAHLRAWMERIEALGRGEITEIDGKEAVEVARKATPRTEKRADPAEPNGLTPGDHVEVVHDSFGRDPVTGELVASSVHEIAIRRRDERAGDVVVHFPREHYMVRRV
ncbi:MAG: glutathione S-transferase family protein [Deltaproteobacteria bacterium]|nr:MAG: glutathione S-transferase family protein [Deltaproteobacteria bacterium]